MMFYATFNIVFVILLSSFETGIHLRRESDKQQTKNQGKTTSKRKLRKRRGHVIRSANTPSDLPSTSRQVSRSHTAEKMVTPPTPVRSKYLTCSLCIIHRLNPFPNDKFQTFPN